MNIQNLVLDINKKCNQLVTANVGEVDSRLLKISVIDNGVPMDLTGITVYLYAKKADGTKVFNTVKVEDAKQGIVSAEITSQVLAIEGFVKLTLLLTKDKARLASKIFTLKVDETIVDDEALESSNEFKALDLALDKVDEWNGYFEETSGKIEEKYTERLNNVSSQLAHIESVVDIPTYNLNKITKELGVTKGIQTVFNEVGTTGVGRILLDKVYEIDEPLLLERTNNNIATSIEIYGGGCIKKSSNFNGDRLLTIKIGYQDEDNIVFNNISFDGVDKTVNGVDTFSTDLAYNLECTDRAYHNESKFVKFYNCTFMKCYHGVRLSALSWVFSGCLFHSNNYGAYLDCSANAITFLGCSLRRNIIGAKLKQFDSSIGTIANGFYNCTIESNRNIGIISKASRNTTLVGNYFENNGFSIVDEFEHHSESKKVHIMLNDDGGAGEHYIQNFYNSSDYDIYGILYNSTVVNRCTVGLRMATNTNFINNHMSMIEFIGNGAYTSTFYVNNTQYKSNSDLKIYKVDNKLSDRVSDSSVNALEKTISISSSLDLCNIEISSNNSVIRGGSIVCELNIGLTGVTSGGNAHSTGFIKGDIIFTKSSDGANTFVVNHNLKLYSTGGASSGAGTSVLIQNLFNTNSEISVTINDNIATIHLDGIVNTSVANWGKSQKINIKASYRCPMYTGNTLDINENILTLS